MERRTLKGVAGVETEGRVLFLRWHAVLCMAPGVLVVPEIVKCLSR